MHDDSNVIVHVLGDIAQEASGDNGNGAKGNGGEINILVTLGKGHLAGRDDNLVRRLVFPDAGDESQALEQAGAGQLDGFGDVGDVFDAELVHHGAADVVFGVGDEFVDEDVVIDRVADDAADDADGEGEGGDGGDEVVRADDGGDDGGGDDDATNAEAGEDEEAPELVEVVGLCNG